MISEPEFDGVWEAGRPAEAAEPAPAGEQVPVRGRRRAPWLWALGGAVVASAVWAGTLAVQNRFGDAPPRIGYRHAEDLCGEEPLAGLSKTLMAFEPGTRRHKEEPALDWSSCMHNTAYSDGQVSYMVMTVVELHKKTDPREEFGAGPGFARDMYEGGSAQQEQVPGLGERAVMSHVIGGYRGPRLEVLDGGAEFTMMVDWLGDEDEQDEDAIKAAMIEDMRALMTRLKK
ncbi:hypothetical protein MTF65_11085 [Streptomyces sp. APSN-46.1]|uniref:hypothetical protein n=1 Tax=Streptomyces sp. APSN-46.1 TaxID=2929049 RepID=UPI001FB4E6A8|nr:hypothetical protein [Streptomyces sp. APSN-46.1]MCJ1677878.1 hypothetical protein [Streptomyces sp. APSN-46.1]